MHVGLGDHDTDGFIVNYPISFMSGALVGFSTDRGNGCYIGSFAPNNSTSCILWAKSSYSLVYAQYTGNIVCIGY